MSEPANFANWTRRDSWRLWEAVVLIGDMEPFPNFLEHLLESQRPNADAMRWRDIIDAARNSCESRDAPWFLGRCDVNRRQFLETPVHPEGFVQWALGKGLAVADELQSWRQRIDSRRAEETDRARLDELAESDPAGRTVRRRAAEKIGLSRLSCWLTAEEIAEIYGDEGLARDIDEDLSRRRLRYCVIRGRATMRDQDLRTGIGRIARNPDGTIYHVGPGCDGLCVHVADFLAWPARPPTPEGKAGELVRAWLGMGTSETAAVPEPEPAENAARVVALPPAEPREVRAMKRSALIRLMRKTYPQADSWFAKTGPGTIQAAAKLKQHGMWNAAAAFSWAEMQTGKRVAVDDWPGEASG